MFKLFKKLFINPFTMNIVAEEGSLPYGATGDFALAEGTNTLASGLASHAEGDRTVASGKYSHAEGSNNQATGSYAHAEGANNVSEYLCHAEGNYNQATGSTCHAEGSSCIASGVVCHAEGGTTTASGDYAHSEGHVTIASGNYSHSEGDSTLASGDYSHAGGYKTIAGNDYQTVIGKYNNLRKGTLQEIGNGSSDYDKSNAFEVYDDGRVLAPSLGTRSIYDPKCLITLEYFEQNSSSSTEEGTGYLDKVLATGTESVAYGYRLKDANPDSHPNLGANAIDLTIYPYSTSYNGATGENSVAIGYLALASGNGSVAIGTSVSATGLESVAMGNGSRASAESYSIGNGVTTSGNWDFATGNRTNASGGSCFVAGDHTTAKNYGMTALGRYNLGESTKTIFEFGNGSSDYDKSNAFEVYDDGRVLAPDLETTNIIDDKCLITKEYLLSAEFGLSLPTSDPYIAGKLWNDNGIMKISAGIPLD